MANIDIGKLEILPDFSEMDEKWQRGEITMREHSAAFTKFRAESKPDDVKIVTGLSSAGVWLGIDKHKSATRLAKELLGLVSPAPVDPGLQEIFDEGHQFEHAIGEHVADWYAPEAVEKHTGKKVDHVIFHQNIPQRYRRSRWPNIIGDIDGMFEVFFEDGDVWWYLGEVKTASSAYKKTADSYWERYFTVGEFPPCYMAQTQGYLCILGPSKFHGVILAVKCKNGCGEYRALVADFDPKAIEMMDYIQSVMEKLERGILPKRSTSLDGATLIDEICDEWKKRANKNQVTIPKGQKPKLVELKSLMDEEAKLTEEYKEIKDKYNEFTRKQNKIREKQKMYCALLLDEEIKGADKGVFEDNEIKAYIDVDRSNFKFDAAVKKQVAEKFPDCWKFLNDNFQKVSFKFDVQEKGGK